MSKLEILTKIKEAWPVQRWANLTVVVACSGGADSVSLLRALTEVKPESTRLVVAHFNHCLRGEDSDQDSRFVDALAFSLGYESIVHRDERSPNSIQHDEASLRDIRYRFLEETAAKIGARYVVTAHTADDQVETFLHQACRGAGLRGLSGMPAFRPLGVDHVLARPLIQCWRSEIIEYLREINQDYRIDRSNESSAYTRNRIRSDIIPQLESLVHHQTRKSILRTTRLLSDLHKLIESQSNQWIREQAITRSSSRIHIAPCAFDPLYWPIIQEAFCALWQEQNWGLKSMSSSHWNDVRQMIISSNHHRIMLPGGIQFSIDDSGWLFSACEKLDSR